MHRSNSNQIRTSLSWCPQDELGRSLLRSAQVCCGRFLLGWNDRAGDAWNCIAPNSASQQHFPATVPSNGSQHHFPAARIGFLSAQVLPNRSFWNSSFHTFPSSTVWTYSALISAVKQTFSITEMVNLLTLPTHNLSKCATPKIRKIPQNNETHERPKSCCWASTTGAKEIK